MNKSINKKGNSNVIVKKLIKEPTQANANAAGSKGLFFLNKKCNHIQDK